MSELYPAWPNDDAVPDDGDSPLGTPDSFDPGYYNDSDGLPQVCRDCGELFLLPEKCKEGNKREALFCQYCDRCLPKFFKDRAAAYESNVAAAKRLGITVEEYYEKHYGP